MRRRRWLVAIRNSGGPVILDPPEFVGVSVDHSDVANTVSPAIPAGTQEGYLMLALCSKSATEVSQVWADDGGGGKGWQRIDNNKTEVGRDLETACYWKVATASERAPTFTIGGVASYVIGVITTYKLVDTETPFDVVYAAADHFLSGENDATPDQPDITTLNDNAMIVAIHVATHNYITAGGAPSGYTLRQDSSPGNTYYNRAAFIADKVKVQAGAESIGPWTHTASVVDQQEYHCYTFALRAGSGVVSYTPSLDFSDARNSQYIGAGVV